VSSFAHIKPQRLEKKRSQHWLDGETIQSPGERTAAQRALAYMRLSFSDLKAVNCTNYRVPKETLSSVTEHRYTVQTRRVNAASGMVYLPTVRMR